MMICVAVLALCLAAGVRGKAGFVTQEQLQVGLGASPRPYFQELQVDCRPQWNLFLLCCFCLLHRVSHLFGLVLSQHVWLSEHYC